MMRAFTKEKTRCIKKKTKKKYNKTIKQKNTLPLQRSNFKFLF